MGAPGGLAVSSPPRAGPVRVLLTYPEQPSEALLAPLRRASDRIELRVCGYQEPHANRSSRGRGEGAAQAPLEARFAEELAQAHAVLALDLPGDLGRRAPHLRWLQAAGAGIEHLLTLGLDHQVSVTNAAGVAAVPIAEFALARILGVWKRTAELDALQRAHRWEATYGRQLAGCTLLIVGLGAIGSALADRAAALGMEVRGIRRNPRPHPSCTEVAGPERFHQLLGQADAVVLSAPSTPETAEMFDRAAFAAMKSGAVFCNVARGTLVDEDALMEALGHGQLGAALLDVTRTEPLPADSPLWDLQNCYISPHSAPAPQRYTEDLYALFADNLERWMSEQPLRNLVDLHRGY